MLLLNALHVQERMLSKQERDIQSMQSQLAALQAELGTELLSQLNHNEQEEVCVEYIGLMW